MPDNRPRLACATAPMRALPLDMAGSPWRVGTFVGLLQDLTWSDGQSIPEFPYRASIVKDAYGPSDTHLGDLSGDLADRACLAAITLVDDIPRCEATVNAANRIWTSRSSALQEESRDDLLAVHLPGLTVVAERFDGRRSADDLGVDLQVILAAEQELDPNQSFWIDRMIWKCVGLRLEDVNLNLVCETRPETT